MNGVVQFRAGQDAAYGVSPRDQHHAVAQERRRRVIDLLYGASQEQAAFVLAKPREALTLAHGMPTALRDPRLSRAGNWLARHLTQALEALVRVENWLRTPNERELQATDRGIVQPLLARVGDQASMVAE